MTNSGKGKYIAFSLILGICICSCTYSGSVSDAAKKAKLATKRISIPVGDKKKISINHKAGKASYSFTSSDKKTASVSKKGIVTAKKKGTANITVRETLSKRKRRLGTVKVKVTPKLNKPEKNTVTNPVNNIPSPSPAQSVAPAPQDTSTPTTVPTATPPAPTRGPLVIDDPSTPSGFDATKNGVEYGTLDKITYHSETVGTDRHANVITPPGYDPDSDKKYPVLYLFHGGNGDENDWLDGRPAQIIGNLTAEGLTEDMIVVMPNCRARVNDGKNPSDSLSLEHLGSWGNFLNDFRDDLMPYIAENYNVYTDRMHTAVAGLSMGGRTALYIGFSMPESIAYIGAFSPAFGIFEYENWGVHEDGYFTPETFTFPEQYMENTTCMIMNGKNDSMVRDEPERYHNALVSNGVNHYYYLVPGDHEMNVWKNGLYNFLKVVFK